MKYVAKKDIIVTPKLAGMGLIHIENGDEYHLLFDQDCLSPVIVHGNRVVRLTNVQFDDLMEAGYAQIC